MRVREREVGREPWSGWVVIDQYESRIGVRVGNRGVGHDEPSDYLAASLTYAEAAELRDVLNEALSDYDGPSEQTPNFVPRPCDACGHMIEVRSEHASYAGPRRRGFRSRLSSNAWVSYDWHISCRPAWAPRVW